MIGAACPKCGASGREHCSTTSGRDHRARVLAERDLHPIGTGDVARIVVDEPGAVDERGGADTRLQPLLEAVARGLRHLERRRQLELPGTLELHPDVLQRTEPWYALRCGLITASAIGRLITVRHRTAIEYRCPSCDADVDEPCRSKTRAGQANKTVHPERTAVAAAERPTSPLILEPADGDDARRVVAIAAAERITGFVDPTYVSLDMQRGQDDEPFAVGAYDEHHARVVDCGFMVRRWGVFALGYSPDGLVGADGLVEVKSRRGGTQVETILSGRVPAENIAQLQAGLFVSGRRWIDYVSYAGGMHLWTQRVEPDPLWFNAIRTAVERFEHDVTATVDAYLEAVKDLPLTERPLLDMVI